MSADVERWKEEGKIKGATHLIVVCDTFDYTDYPVYVYNAEELSSKRSQYSGNMQRIMEEIKLK